MGSNSYNLLSVNVEYREHLLLTTSIRRYAEPLWGRRSLGTGRWSLDLGKTSFILELWFIRTGKRSPLS